MEKYARRYGFKWVAHEVNHSNRKAGKERNFRTINTNFFPGRTFKSLVDLNEQVLKWATVRYFNRPQSKSKLIPQDAFKFEKAYMKVVSPYISSPYRIHSKRKVDPKGYVAFNGNYYWTPEGTRGHVDVLEYVDSIKIIQNHKTIDEYKLPEWDVKNQKFSPDGKTVPMYQPKNIKKGFKLEEKSLTKIDDVIGKYIEYIRQNKNIPQKPRLIRQLYSLSKKLTTGLFIKTINRALLYKIHSISEIEAIATELMKMGEFDNPPAVSSCLLPDDFKQRGIYRRGQFSEEQDSAYLRNLQKGIKNE